jgi:Sec-independent protein translocase protein TatA
MFGLGPWEIAVIVGAVLLVAGPALLPKLGGYMGKTLTGLRDSAASFSENIREEMNADREADRTLLASGEESVSDPKPHSTSEQSSTPA